MALPKLSAQQPIVNPDRRPSSPFLQFMEAARSSQILTDETQDQILADLAQAVADILAAQATADAADIKATAAQTDADAALTTANAADAAVDGLADGTTSHTGLNVGGVNVKPFLDQTDGTKITAPGALGPAVVETDAVLQGAITPIYAATTTTAVLWSAEATEKSAQTVNDVAVTRGDVLVSALVNTTMDGAPAATFGTLRLYRDGVQITDASAQLQEISGSLPRQFNISFIDSPGPGTYDYEIKFVPGHTATGQIYRRTLVIIPLEG